MTGSSASFFLSHFLASMDAAFWRYNQDEDPGGSMS